MRRGPTAAVLLLAAVLAGACGASATVTGGVPTPSPAFPVRVGAAADSVLIPARPTRILSLSPSATQMLYAIGAGRQVVGVDEHSTYPADAPRTKFTGYESSAEVYLAERPDLVLLAFDTTHLVAQLKELHIPALLLPPATTVADAESQIDELGAATGDRSGAASTVGSVNVELDKVARSVGGRARGDTYYIEFDPTLYSATSKTFAGALFSRLGMVNIADPAGRGGDAYPQLSAEYLIKANPKLVYLADTVCCGQSAMTFARRSGFSVLQAVRNHDVFVIDDSFASQWGPHTLALFASLIASSITTPRAPGVAASDAGG